MTQTHDRVNKQKKLLDTHINISYGFASHKDQIKLHISWSQLQVPQPHSRAERGGVSSGSFAWDWTDPNIDWF